MLVGRTNADMAQLKSMYYAKYHKSLESDVKSDVSGYFEKLLMMSMQVRRGAQGGSEWQSIEGNLLHENMITSTGTDYFVGAILQLFLGHA